MNYSEKLSRTNSSVRFYELLQSAMWNDQKCLMWNRSQFSQHRNYCWGGTPTQQSFLQMNCRSRCISKNEHTRTQLAPERTHVKVELKISLNSSYEMIVTRKMIRIDRQNSNENSWTEMESIKEARELVDHIIHTFFNCHACSYRMGYC